MAFARKDIQESVKRAGEEHWDALIAHHEEAYPESRPTPGDVCAGEAARLNELGLGEDDLVLVESRVERVGDEVRITHVLEDEATGERRGTEPYTDYG